MFISASEYPLVVFAGNFDNSGPQYKCCIDFVVVLAHQSFKSMAIRA